MKTGLQDAGPDSSTPWQSADRWAVVVVFCVAALVRLAYVWAHGATPLADELLFNRDGQYYDLRAREIAEGDLVGRWVAYLSPGYCYAVGALYWLVGPSIEALRIVQAGLGAATCALCFVLGRRLFGYAAGLGAGLLLAVYTPHIYYTTWLLPTVWLTFLYVAAAVVLTRPRAVTWTLNGLVAALLGGALLGAAVVTKANAALALPLVAAWACCCSREVPLAARLGWVAALSLAFALVLTPLLAVNHAVSGRLVVTTTSVGVNLAKGNGPTANGTHVLVPRELAPASVLSPYLQGSVDAAAAIENDRNMRVWTFAYMRERPWATAALWLRKLALFVNETELGVHDRIDFAEAHLAVLRWPLPNFSVLGPVALSGLLLAPWRWSGPLLLRALLAGQVFSFVVVFVLGRYRLPAVAMALPFVGWQLAAWWRQTSERDWRGLGFSALVLLAATVAVHAPVSDLEAELGLGNQYALLARHYAAKEDCESAVGAYERARVSGFRPVERLPAERWRAMESAAICYRSLGLDERADGLIAELRAEVASVHERGTIPYLSPRRGADAEPFALTLRERTQVGFRLKRLPSVVTE